MRPANSGFNVGRRIVNYQLDKQVTENPIYSGLNKISPHKIKYPEVRSYLLWFSRSKMSSGHSGASFFQSVTLVCCFPPWTHHRMVTSCSPGDINGKEAGKLLCLSLSREHKAFRHPYIQQIICLDLID